LWLEAGSWRLAARKRIELEGHTTPSAEPAAADGGVVSKQVVSPIVVPEFAPQAASRGNRSIEVLADVPALITVVAGRTEMTIKQLKELAEGDIITLDRSPDATVDIFVNGTHIARGDVIVLDDSIATRVSDMDPRPDPH
jgi:flagellar motor switch protein FliN